jgi:hypothetical protein
MESGGPRVTLRTRRGFGSAIILEAAQQFGNVSMIYRPEGLVYQLQVDLKEIKPSSVTLGERRVRSGAREALGRTDLVPAPDSSDLGPWPSEIGQRAAELSPPGSPGCRPNSLTSVSNRDGKSSDTG